MVVVDLHFRGGDHHYEVEVQRVSALVLLRTNRRDGDVFDLEKVMCFADLAEREEALRYGKVYDIHGSPPYADGAQEKKNDDDDKQTAQASHRSFLRRLLNHLN